jgi:hypothetical protein
MLNAHPYPIEKQKNGQDQKDGPIALLIKVVIPGGDTFIHSVQWAPLPQNTESTPSSGHSPSPVK